MKSIIPPKKGENDEDVRLFQVQFILPLPKDLAIPRDKKEWVAMLTAMCSIEDGSALAMTGAFELKFPIEDDTMDAASKSLAS